MKIPGYSRYTIEEDGTVVDTKTGEIVPRKTNARYDWVRIIPDDYPLKESVHLHVLMALAFLGPRPDGCVVRFIDGNNKNLAPNNLKWISRSDLAKEFTHIARKPRTNRVIGKESAQLVYDTMVELDEPVTMMRLAELLELPYSVVRYSMYGLIASGKAQATEGGYEVNA
jgi:hypothetical protein